MRVRIARDELRRIRELTQTIKALEAEIADLVAQIAPQLLTEPGFGPLTAAKLVGEIAGAQRFASDAKLARAAGIAPIPVSSATPAATGSTAAEPPDQHHDPPHRGDPPALPRRNEGLHRAQAHRGQKHQRRHRCLKRHLTRRIWHLLQTPAPIPDQTLTHSTS